MCLFLNEFHIFPKFVSVAQINGIRMHIIIFNQRWRKILNALMHSEKSGCFFSIYMKERCYIRNIKIFLQKSVCPSAEYKPWYIYLENINVAIDLKINLTYDAIFLISYTCFIVCICVTSLSLMITSGMSPLFSYIIDDCIRTLTLGQTC